MIEPRIIKKITVSRREHVSQGKWIQRYYRCRVDVELDLDGILQLIGDRAMGNKSKKSRLLSGLIKGEIQVGEEIKDI